MNQNEEKILRAQLLKLKSEISLNTAEERKINAEIIEIEKRVLKSGISKIEIIKVIIGGIVAAGLLAAWFIVYMQPLLEANSKLSEIENKTLAAENKDQSIRNEKDRILLQETRNALNLVKDSTIKKIKELQIQNELLAIEYKNLAVRGQSNKAEQAKYFELAKKSTAESKRLRTQLISLQNQKIVDTKESKNFTVKYNEIQLPSRTFYHGSEYEKPYKYSVEVYENCRIVNIKGMMRNGKGSEVNCNGNFPPIPTNCGEEAECGCNWGGMGKIKTSNNLIETVFYNWSDCAVRYAWLEVEYSPIK